MFKKGDRVVLEFDNFQEFGTVRWVSKGLSHDSGSENMVGVEFDNPVGDDNHKINGHWLFEALPNHGLLLPASSLMIVEDDSYPLGRCFKKHVKQHSEAPLGDDMSSLSTFHKMAYECLTSSGKPLSTKNSLNISYDPPVSPYGDKENLDVLPQVSYGSYKNILGSSKVSTDIGGMPKCFLKTRPIAIALFMFIGQIMIKKKTLISIIVPVFY